MNRIGAERMAQIVAICEQAGVSVDEASASLLAEHLQYVLEANARARLTAIRTFEDGVRLHVLDSLYAVPYVAAAPAGPVLDMGSGGGYPGIPIAVLAGREVCLVDSVGKKMRIMQEFIDSQPRLVGIVTTSAARLEALGDWVPAAGFAVIVARALSSLPALVELAAPLMAVGGHLVCMKGDLPDEELSRGNLAAKLVGLRLVSSDRYLLPSGEEKRTIVVYERSGNPKIRIPRREGMAQRNPLA